VVKNSTARQLSHLPVLPKTHQEQSADCADQGHAHIFLRVPNVALRPEEGVGSRASDHCGGPLEQFVKGADAHADEDDDGKSPTARCDYAQSDEKFASDQCRDKSLGKMSESIEVIALPTEQRFEPGEKRDPRISVMTANAKQHDVQRDQGVDQGGETKATVGGDEKNRARDTGSGLKPPGQSFVRAPSGPDEDQHRREEQRQVKWRNAGVHFASAVASSTARRIAAIMLSARAMPFPAISNAVP